MRIFAFLAVVASLLALPSCRSGDSSAHVLDHATFARTYADLLESSMRLRAEKADSVRAASVVDSVFLRNGVRREDYEATVIWYNGDVARWKGFTDSVARVLEQKMKPSPARP